MFTVLRHRLLPALVLAAMLAATASLVAAEDIDPQNDNSQFAWGENVGWINAEPSGQNGPGIDVAHNELTGHMYGENVGWISLNCKNRNTCGTVQYGVTNDGTGKLGGYAWGENVGWISFCDQDPVPGPCKTVGSEYRVVIDRATGIFSGFAWGENIGWISFGDSTPIAYKVQTEDGDGDGVSMATDNCLLVVNTNQVNTDNAPIVTSPAPNDTTVANSDLAGDLCDEDDDNDGILDVNEAAGCNGGTNLGTTNADTDGDGARDGAECFLGTNPNNAGDKPPAVAISDPDADGLSNAHEAAIGSNPNDFDTDDDGIIDGLEVKGYSTSPTLANTDGDVCPDDSEIVSLDLNIAVNSSDLFLVAQSVNPQPWVPGRPNHDIDKNGLILAQDLFLVALNFDADGCGIP